MKKYRARPLVNRNRCSAGLPWLVITELARSRRSVAAARMISRFRGAIPSNSRDFKPAGSRAAIPVAGIDESPQRSPERLELLRFSGQPPRGLAFSPRLRE